MENLDLRRYEHLLVELVRDEASPEQRQLLREHSLEVAQLRYLSDPACVDRDSEAVRKWFESEWARMPHRIHRRLRHELFGQ